MNNVITNPALNPSQLYILRLFAENRTDDDLEELKSVLLDYYQKKLDKAADSFWDSQHLDNVKMEEIMYGHLRASSK
jgi:hypothetical protein